MAAMPEPTPSEFPCGRCTNPTMAEQTWGGVPVRICMRCGSNFFGAGSLAQWEHWSADIPPSAERLARHRSAAVHCPACAAPMDRLSFPLEPALDLDRCGECQGILLDFEEIRRVPELQTWAIGRAREKASGGSPR
jgi:hypothetical protein